MSIKLNIICPSNDIGFVEYKRSFCVQGDIISDRPLNDNCELLINIYNQDHQLVRYVKSNKKNQDIFRYHPDLTIYEESLDPNREKMSEFGFPELIVDDLSNPYDSIRKASIKCWYSDYKFKAIIISASNIKNGAICSDGFDFVDDNNKPFNLLEKGKYYIEVLLMLNNELLAKTNKEFIIDSRDIQFICRFNPISHKQAMIKWCDENHISIIKDTLPGYLDPYLGKWYYHMGLLKMYRANDLCLYENTKVIMFVYLIEQNSTSYATELAYLQSKGLLKNKNRFECYHYDIGEAIVNNRVGKIVNFVNDIDICRIDIVNDKAKENVYYLDNRAINYSIYDLNNIEINRNDTIQIMGVIKLNQLNEKDFILNDDNTFKINNYPAKIVYELNYDNKIVEYEKTNLMERVDDISIGKSIYEFYNILQIDKNINSNKIIVNIKCFDNYSNILGRNNFSIKLKEEH